MQSFLKKYWFRLALVVAILLPALVTQTVYPVFSHKNWEILADKFYTNLLLFEKPDTDTDSAVVIIEVDQNTIDKFGWPISRDYYSSLFKKLQEKGHPYVLSMLSFQALHKSNTFNESKFKKMDEDLAERIRSYGRIIGTSMMDKDGSELTGWQEDELMPRIALSNAQTPPDELPYLPMHFIEDDMFLDAQLATGFATRRGDATVSFCSQMYITDGAFAGTFVIPSSLTWISAFTSGRGFLTKTGAAWPRNSEEAPVSTENPINIGFRHCVSAPKVLTDAFFEKRGVNVISMADVVDETFDGDFSGKAVILAAENSSGFPGPGNPYTGPDGKLIDNKVKEYEFAARLVDDMLTGKSIRRENLSRYEIFDRLPLIAAGVLVVLSFFGLTRLLMLSSSLIFGGAVAWSVYYLQQGIYLIPIQLIVFAATGTLSLLALDIYLRFYGISREIRFSAKLRKALAQCNTIFEIENITQNVCSTEFSSCKLIFEGFDRGLYKAAANPKDALQYLDNNLRRLSEVFDRKEDTNIRKMPVQHGLRNLLSQEKGYRINLNIVSKEVFLGTAKIKLHYMPHEERFIKNLMESLRLELCQHWNRIKLLVDQKLLDYKMLMEQTRSDILARFLTQTLVSRFSNKMTMEENLNLVLTPRPTRAALMQADIRGYSRISAQLAPKDMVQLLQNYYKNVVDAAQQVAQVKLIGDCIFLFIEESSAQPDASPVDLCVELASILVTETNKQNHLRESQNQEPMFFGVAIHYGEVVVGNLSSDSCIDYTVIGPNVNMVARLEEMTKHPAIAEKIGRNGTIISEDAMRASKKHRLTHSEKLDLAGLNASVRSFANVTHVYGVTAEEVLTVKPEAFEKLPQAS